MTLPRHRVEDHRAATLGGGTIFHEGRSVPCLVRAISEAGASLQVYAPDKLPPRFRAYLERERREVDCEIVWREGKVVGVAFGDRIAVTRADHERPGRGFDGTFAGVAACALPSGREAGPVLIVEDDPDDRELIAAAFGEMHDGPGISFVRDGGEALIYLRRIGEPRGPARPSLIVLDLNMPKVDGRDVLRHVKTTAALSAIPVVVLTTSSTEEDVVSTYALGASSYIVKPSRYADLLGAVHAMTRYWSGPVVLPRRPH